jgi:hypothetical protein
VEFLSTTLVWTGVSALLCGTHGLAYVLTMKPVRGLLFSRAQTPGDSRPLYSNRLIRSVANGNGVIRIQITINLNRSVADWPDMVRRASRSSANPTNNDLNLGTREITSTIEAMLQRAIDNNNVITAHQVNFPEAFIDEALRERAVQTEVEIGGYEIQIVIDRVNTGGGFFLGSAFGELK